MDIQDVEDTEEVDRTSQREQGQGESRQGRAEKAPARRAWWSSAALYLSIHSWSLLT